LSTSKKSPTRSVGSIDPEGIRNGCTMNVTMKIAKTIISRIDFSVVSKPSCSTVV